MSEEIESTDNTPGEDKNPIMSTERDDKGRFVVEDTEEKAPEHKPTPTKPVPAKSAPAKAKDDAVEAEVKAEKSDAVEITLSALAYSPRKRNSQSVALLQDRLAELGQKGVRADLRGWFHDNTQKALEGWQSENGKEVTGVCSEADAKALFAGTKVVVK
jgi:hypothetical protein